MARGKRRRKRRREENKALEIHPTFFFFFFILEHPNSQLVHYFKWGSQRPGRGNKQHDYEGRIMLLKV